MIATQTINIKERVQRLLRWDDAKYAEFQERMGYRYLAEELEADHAAIKALTQNRLFWAWWINHWNRRDESFLHLHEGTATGCTVLEQIYRLKHNPNAIVFSPQRTILRHSFPEMIGNLIDQLHND